ncbi:hypothetical protein MKW94_014159, partial [Papaver nudicaule]|nr:hypothetical protein [Papaver nudicaule]
MSSSQLIFETVKGSHEFKIQGYSQARGTGAGRFKTSAKFTVGRCDWVVAFYPDGYNQASKEYVSMFVKLVSPTEASASYDFKLLDQRGKGIHKLNNGPKTPLPYTRANPMR